MQRHSRYQVSKCLMLQHTTFFFYDSNQYRQINNYCYDTYVIIHLVYNTINVIRSVPIAITMWGITVLTISTLSGQCLLLLQCDQSLSFQQYQHYQVSAYCYINVMIHFSYNTITITKSMPVAMAMWWITFLITLSMLQGQCLMR